MKIVLNYKKFLEANLDLGELSKDRNGEPRGNVLVRAIKNGDPVKVGQKKVVIDKMAKSGKWVEPNDAIDQITNPQGGYDSDKGLKYFKDGGKYGEFTDVFLDEEGDDFGLDDIVKTEEFGSKGAGRTTLKFESLQCIFLGIKIYNYNTELSSDNIEACFRRYLREAEDFPVVRISEKVIVDFELLGEYLKDEDWVETFCQIPNKLWHGNPVKDSSVDPNPSPDKKELRQRYVDESKPYIVFHTGYKGTESPYVILKQRFKELAKLGKFTDIDFNKWCPADTYIINEDILKDFKSIITGPTTMYEFIKKCDELFDKQDMIPISLKKVKVGSDYKIITNGELGADLPEFKITNFRVGSSLKGIGSKIDTKSQWKYRDEVVDTKDRTINFDSSDTGKKTDVDGEVQGSSTRGHGKINFTAIKRIINSKIGGAKKMEMNNLPPLLTYDEISKIVESRQKKSKLTKSEELENWCKDLIEQSREIQKQLGETFKIEEIRGRKIEGNVNKLISRIQSLQIVMLIGSVMMMNRNLANRIITSIMRYALSIQTDKFDTPRYLRVI